MGAAWRGREEGARKGRGGLDADGLARKSISGDLTDSAAKEDESDHSEQDKRASRRLEPGCFARLLSEFARPEILSTKKIAKTQSSPSETL